MVLNTTSLALKRHQKLGSTYLIDKVTNVYVFTLWKLLIREKRIESLSIRLDGMKCKYHNNHSSHRNHARNLIYNLVQYDNIPIPTSSENLKHLSDMVLIKSSFSILIINCLKIFSNSQKSQK